MIAGRRVLLRPTVAADLPSLTVLRNDVALQRQLMARTRGSTLASTEQWIQQRSNGPLDLFLVIAPAEATHDVAGFIQLAQGDMANLRAELGVCVGSAWQGRGLASEAVQLLMAYARDVLGLQKIVLTVLAENARARALYVRLGFREVGLLQAHFRYGQHWLDAVLMEMRL